MWLAFWWCECNLWCGMWLVTEAAVGGVYGHLAHCLPVFCEHLLHPAAERWVARAGRVTLVSDDLQSSLLRLGPCLRHAMGGSGRESLSSGLSESMVRWCFFKTLLIFGRRGLKSNTALTLFFIPGSIILIFFCKAFFLFSEKFSPGKSLTLLNWLSILLLQGVLKLSKKNNKLKL